MGQRGPYLLAVATYCAHLSRAWTPPGYYGMSAVRSTILARSRPALWWHPYGRSSSGSTSGVPSLAQARRLSSLRRSAGTEAQVTEDSLWDTEQPEAKEQSARPRAKMIDSPIPDYLVDMLKEAGEIDENGKPLNDFYDPDDDEEFGSKRIKEHNAEVEDDCYDVPFGEMLYESKSDGAKDTGSLMETTIDNAVIEFGFPVEFFLDILCRWGVTPPVKQNVRLGDLIDAEQAAGLYEALTGLDAADVRDNYLDDTLEDLAVDLSIPLPDLLQACATHKVNLPLGGETHITIDEYKVLLDKIVDGGETSAARRLFDDSRTVTRWAGQKDLGKSHALNEDTARLLELNNMGFDWKNGPPVIGNGEGELPVEAAHISGRIFGEDAFFGSAGEGPEGDDSADFLDMVLEDEPWA